MAKKTAANAASVATGTTFRFDGPARSAARGGGRAAPAAAPILLVPLVSKPAPAAELLKRADRICGKAVSELVGLKSLGDETGKIATTTRARGSFPRIAVVELGERAKVDGNAVRRAGAAAARILIAEKLDRAALWIDGLIAIGLAGAAAEFAYGMMLGGFKFSEFRSKNEGPKQVRVSVNSSSGDAAAAMQQIRELETLAAAVNYSRSIAHLPPNVLNPESLAAEAKRMGAQFGIRCTVIAGEKLANLGMNGILAVGTGALHPPCLIALEYRGDPGSKATTVVVGKAVTFDTGGYSIKPADNMDAMKFDKCGGMTVLGVLRAAADLRLKCNVVGLIAAAENAISERAYRPGDILRMYSGKTVEITNTDAEGRLVLADALWYGQQEFKPTYMINLATLTGGMRVALGTAAAGIFGNNDALAHTLGECGKFTHERLWRLPLWDDYKELIRSTEADIKNSAGKRDAHSIVGGMFLKEFVKDETPWAHLDIAGVATADDNRGITAKGATGWGVRLLVEFLKRQCR